MEYGGSYNICMLYQKIREDQTVAQKARDARLLGVLRLMTSEIAYKAMENHGEVSDEQVVAILTREAKKREEAIAIYEKANDVVRADQEKYELGVIKGYLPELMSEELLAIEVEKIAGETDKRGGQLIGMVAGRLKGKADGSLIAKIVNAKFSA